MATMLKDLIEKRKEKSFYDPETVSDEEALGVLIAVHYQWDAKKIIEAFQYALEDANFHTLNSKISELIREEFSSCPKTQC